MKSNNIPIAKKRWLVLTVIGTGIAAGCASNGGYVDERDPWEGFNRSIFELNDAVDRTILKPIAKGYQAVAPDPVETGVTNFFSNLHDVTVTANDLLQLKFEQGLSDGSRVVYNTTFGILGIFDVATFMGLPKHEEDYGQTLGHWGVPSGPYVVLPFLGPSTVRDTGGLLAQFYTDPLYQVRDVALRNSAAGLRVVDDRANLLGVERVLEEAALDRYTFVREAYLQRRRNLIYDGNPPPEADFDTESLDDEAPPEKAPGTRSPSQQQE